MNLEFKSVRVVNGLVFADHDTLPSLHLTPYLAQTAIEDMLAAEELRQIAERRESLRSMAADFQAEALHDNKQLRGVDYVTR